MSNVNDIISFVRRGSRFSVYDVTLGIAERRKSYYQNVLRYVFMQYEMS